MIKSTVKIDSSLAIEPEKKGQHSSEHQIDEGGEKAEAIKKIYYNPKRWNLYPEFKSQTEQNIESLTNLKEEVALLKEQPKRRNIRNSNMNAVVMMGKTGTMERAYGMQKKW